MSNIELVTSLLNIPETSFTFTLELCEYVTPGWERICVVMTLYMYCRWSLLLWGYFPVPGLVSHVGKVTWLLVVVVWGIIGLLPSAIQQCRMESSCFFLSSVCLFYLDMWTAPLWRSSSIDLRSWFSLLCLSVISLECCHLINILHHPARNRSFIVGKISDLFIKMTCYLKGWK